MGRPPFSVRPLYLQVYDKLTSLIADGSWKTGTMIANEVDLARDLGVSVGTVRKALQLMVDRRLLTRRQGRGTFIADHQASSETAFDNLVDRETGGMHWTIRVLEVSTGEADEDERAALGLRRGRPVIRRRRMLHDIASGTRMLEDSSLARDHFSSLSEDDHAAHVMPIWQLAQAHGYILGSCEESVSVTACSEQEAHILGAETTSPLLRLSRTVFSLDLVPIEWRTALCMLAPHTQYIHKLG